MFRTALFAVVALSLACAPFALTAQEKKEDKKDEKKDEKKKEVKKEETLKIGNFDLTIGEWIKMLRTDENPGRRRLALLALKASNTAGKAGLPALLDTIAKDKNTTVRREAVALLGDQDVKTPGAMKTLVEVLQSDPEGEVREEAALAIGGPFVKQIPDYILALAEALKKDEKHAGTRIAVAAALRNLGADRELGEKVKPALPRLLEVLRDTDENQQVRAAAIHVLGRHDKDNTQMVAFLVSLLKNDKTPLALREAAADGLGRSKGDSADVITALCDTLTDKKLEMRKAAAVALVMLGDKTKSGWPAIKARVAYQGKEYTPVEFDSSVRNHLIRLTGVLAKANAEAVTSLTDAAVHDTSTEIRIAAIQELGELETLPKETRAALDTIRREDPRQAIREASARALKIKS